MSALSKDVTKRDRDHKRMEGIASGPHKKHKIKKSKSSGLRQVRNGTGHRLN